VEMGGVHGHDKWEGGREIGGGGKCKGRRELRKRWGA